MGWVKMNVLGEEQIRIMNGSLICDKLDELVIFQSSQAASLANKHRIIGEFVEKLPGNDFYLIYNASRSRVIIVSAEPIEINTECFSFQNVWDYDVVQVDADDFVMPIQEFRNIKITGVTFIGDINGWFAQCAFIESIIIEDSIFKTAEFATCMCTDCYELKHIEFRRCKAEGLTTLNNAFFGCRMLETAILELDASVVQMKAAFQECEKLKSVDLSHLVKYVKSESDLNKDINIEGIFDDCTSLERLKMTRKIGDMKISYNCKRMLPYCQNINGEPDTWVMCIPEEHSRERMVPIEFTYI